MRAVLPFIFFTLFVLADWYFFQAVKTVVRDSSVQKQTVVKYVYLITSAFTLLTFLAMTIFPSLRMNRTFSTYIGSIAFILAVVKLLGALILMIEDITRAFRYLFELIRSRAKPDPDGESIRISRLKFISYVSLTFAAVPFLSFMYGVIRGAYRYTIHRTTIKSPRIPAAFDGLKIIQVSDIHTGSFTNTDGLEKAFSIIQKEKPDVIFFTGDLVNNIYTETNGFLDTYRMLQAPMGVYSVFGNHDYGDYMHWDSKEDQLKAQAELRNVHKEAGWRLLWDELVELEKDGEKIAVMGIQNWGARGFTKYGDLAKAYTGAEKYPYKILLSHDPSHWDHQVTTEFKDIDLTLSGHTHGMQFGVEIPGIKWSPIKYMYPNWAGLYQDGEQYLYVNRGLGFLGYPGRVGIWPEITVINLQKA